MSNGTRRTYKNPRTDKKVPKADAFGPAVDLDAAAERGLLGGAVVFSPADGKVVAVRSDKSGGNRISIFLNVFDVHVNRTPIPGKVTCVTYKKGEFLVASKEEASAENEQNIITVEGT